MTEVYKNSTSLSRFFELVDSTTGLPKTGIVYTDVTGSYTRAGGARVAITPATLASADAAWSSGGFILVDDTNAPGLYRVDVPNAAFASGVDEVVVTIKATGCRTVSRGFTLIDWNKQVAAIPNAAANATGGLYTLGGTGVVLADAAHGGSSASLTVSAISVGAGGMALTGGISSLGGFTGAIAGNITGNLSGSVGSVAGSVGGNVTGSIGSVATGGIVAGSIAASALNGKGDWNVGKTGYALAVPPLDAAATRAAVGLADANLDSQLSIINIAAALAGSKGLVQAIGACDTGSTTTSIVMSDLDIAGTPLGLELHIPELGETRTITAWNAGTETATVAAFSSMSANDYTWQLLKPLPAPTAAENASGTRTELATELARIDATISSRLAAASYTASSGTSQSITVSGTSVSVSDTPR